MVGPVLELRSVLNSSNRWKVLVGCTALFFALYGIPNRFSLGTPSTLPLTEFDQATPFWLESVWIYFSAYGMIFVTFFRLRELRTLNRLLYSFLMLTALSSAVFVLFPTVYPRGLFPLPEDAAWTTLAFSWLRAVDLPTNCAPSLHVGISVLSTLPFFTESQRKTGTFFLLWTLAIWISTVTTKQHYWIDGLLGGGLAAGIYRFFGSRFVRYLD
jgi:hypothetical protein